MLELDQLIHEARTRAAASESLAALDEVRVHYLGKKGVLTEQLKVLGSLPAMDRPAAGQRVNRAKQAITELLDARRHTLEEQALAEQLAADAVDVTLPGRGQEPGGMHPVTRILERVQALFTTLGFRVEVGPEIEDEFHNFDALNFKPAHPARAEMDTFYLKDRPLLLRTHTSPVQIRALLKYGAPLRVIAPGRTFRHDYDVTHTPMFHQVEGLLVDKGVSMAHLRGTLTDFLQRFFEKDDLKLRFRPSYFPFVEPGAEVDISCIFCDGSGCRVCKHAGWLEVLGCGLVHPNVLETCHVDTERYSGWAFGVGIERLGMLRYGINDIRMNYENDLRFLRQFR
ncbi:MAG: phenylalanine--tRNA ligase subunit alpha [Gammaproteobacteria bacterium]|nr:phenylalanine--tRNA ligase subunit alpha [Gammaproteobacteria bacterium]MDE1887402.1 phenylalanine--tRNA ligase subunit alpha [Gammaproteobacteria bacterium]MDE2022786.1 phenylalanine--tRNA ligase subunit alpha [Gammaproteobacteria bacterium]MDE2140106.1 phenylalanine--tRNA ligase subunit alpha [Gammaproteobacteria bacterium]MDE2274465.1 phenylalanine--tRNA ligase subunit alpha [Gammaproteobacteria bacterium]